MYCFTRNKIFLKKLFQEGKKSYIISLGFWCERDVRMSNAGGNSLPRAKKVED